MLEPLQEKKFGRYKIVSKLGEGGMGIVYKAIDPVLERNVALKVGKMAVAGNAEKREKALKEARLAAQFIHPNIAIIYDAGFEGSTFYMAIEHIEGVGLHRHARRPKLLPRQKVVEIIFNMCHALHFIHARGYVHLDIKPSNIMLTRMGEIKLMDFGIARFLKEKSDNGKISGSIHYMSPEQADAAAELTCQADIYSLGIVLYELLTGYRPFEGENLYQVLYKITHEGPVSIGNYIPDISPELEAVVVKSIHKNKGRRFNSMLEFADALFPIIRGTDSKVIDKQDKKKIPFLKQLTFFKHFQYGELVEVINISKWSFYKKDTCIIDTNKHDSNIYFIVHGKAALHLNKVVKKFTKGDCFGESAILYNMPRQAMLMAETDCMVMAINANLLNQAQSSLQVKFFKEFYRNKMQQLVETNLKLIQFENKTVFGSETGREKYSEHDTGLLLTSLKPNKT